MNDSAPFQKAGRQIALRLQAIAAMRWMNVGVAILSGVIAILVFGLRIANSETSEWGLAAGLIGLWLVGNLAFLVLLRKSPLQALAKWDEAAGGKSELASAEFFEKQPAEKRSIGEELHLDRAQQLLAERRKTLSQDLPVPRPFWTWLALPVVLALIATPLLKPTLALEDLAISEEMRQRAAEEAARIAEERKSLESLTELSEDEKKQLQELGASLDEAAEMLANAGDLSSRELLEALEARARAAEEMADQLGDEAEKWASEEMLEEMARHADTTDLAAAIMEKDAELSADESRNLAAKLAAPDLSIEAESRVDEALGRTMEKATDEDHERPVGDHVGQASTNLDDDKSGEAATEFEELADYFRDVARREKAREDLKDLAEQLRESGANIAESQLEQMQALGNGEKGEQQLPPGVQDLANAPMQQQMQGPQNQGGEQLPLPGLQNQAGQEQKPGQTPGQALQAPVPGMPPPGQNGQQSQIGMAPGGDPNGEEQGGISAPVPGAAPGGSAPNAAALGGDAGGSTTSGSGLQAGVGTAEMGKNPTEALRATKDGVVDATINEDGDSEVQRVEGGVRVETAQAQQREAAVNFIAVEEEALDGKALPVSRRDQVLRYFTALRQQFETEDE
ncbi:MAG: hypothetical protein ACI8UO_002010 [Verrucomicrobiales bacterium]|jgi:hypothetical protein